MQEDALGALCPPEKGKMYGSLVCAHGWLQASAPGKKKAAAAPAQGSKAAAAAAEQQVSPAAAAPAADPPVLTEEQMKAKVEEALAKALADTEEIRKAAWQQQVG